MINKIAALAKQTRDKSFIAEEGGVRVNRTDAIASLGASVLNNEDLYLISKFMRSLGVVYLEHQARICHSSTVAGLGPSLMTNHWTDFKNTDLARAVSSGIAAGDFSAERWSGDLAILERRFGGWAAANGLDAESLLQLVHWALSPFRRVAAEIHRGALKELATNERSTCPVCGRHPDFALLSE